LGDGIGIIGCGAIGAAVARQFAAAGHDVVVWNRSPERTRAVAADRIAVADSVSAVVESSPIVVLCVTGYDDARAALEPVHAWGGTVLVNLVTGTPAEARDFASWAAARGVAYLDGVICAYPQDIGAPATMVLYAGPERVWSRVSAALAALGGGTRRIDDDIAVPNVLDVAVAVFYTAALGGFAEALAYARASGAGSALVESVAGPMLDVLRRDMRDGAAAVESGKHETDQATIDGYIAALGTWCRAVQEQGQDARLMSATRDNLLAAAAAGHGHLGFFAQCRSLAACDRELR
jgi:3-hydroxyisobutyrate dehydrogenase-like beta-hydroxyacid dehydrogenase